METTAKSKAALQFMATQKQTERIQTEIEKARQERTDNMARQRALRLEKEAADKIIADQLTAEKEAEKAAKKSKKK